MTEITDFEYPDIRRTDYIDESLSKILSRDDASKHSFRRKESFPNVTANDLYMKVHLAGVGEFQLISVDPEPQWKQLTDDSRVPAYMDTLTDGYQPLSPVLTSMSRLTTASNVIPYFNGPNDIQATTITPLSMSILGQSDPAEIRTLLGLGTAATLSTPINGSYIAAGSISKDKIDENFARNLGWTTGDVKLTFKFEADEGWIMMNDGSISVAGLYNSNGDLVREYNATNFNPQALFYLLWNISNDFLPILSSAGVPTNRGVSAAADWAARKRLSLPKTMGRAMAGAGAGVGLTGRTLGSSWGEESHTLTWNEMPAHAHSLNVHSRGYPDKGYDNPGSGNGYQYLRNVDPRDDQSWTREAGGNQPHNNMQPTTFLNVMIKL